MEKSWKAFEICGKKGGEVVGGLLKVWGMEVRTEEQTWKSAQVNVLEIKS